MRMNRIVLAALTLALAVPTIVAAQGIVYRAGPRGMLGFASEQSVGSDGTVRRIVVDVVKGSPAEKAGVAVGDTLVRFNGLQPRSELLSAFAPGDTIVLRLRRNGRERDVRVVAAERGGTFVSSFDVLPDSIRNHINIMIDAVRADIDTLHFPRLRIEKLHGDSAIVFFGNNRVFALPENIDVHLDSIRTLMLRHSPTEWRVFGDSGRFNLLTDSLLRGGRLQMFGGDSSRIRIWTTDSIPGAARGFGLRGDSTFVELFAGGRGRMSMGDSMFVRPAEIITRNFTIGMRAIAGAELFELNPELGETLGAREGVLVLNASDGTPAAKAGLRGGDVITRADGEAVSSIESLRRIVSRAQPGAVVRLEVLRRGNRLTVNLNRQ